MLLVPSLQIDVYKRQSMDNTDKVQDGSLAILSGYGYVDHRHDVIDGKYVYVPMENNYREYLKFMNKLWEEDILDHEIFTQTEEQYLAKCQNYTVGLFTKGEASQYFSDDEKKRAYSLVGPLLSDCLLYTSGESQLSRCL